MATDATGYFGVGTSPSTTEAANQQVVSSGGNFTSLYCVVSVAPGSENSWAMQLRDNTANVSGFTCTISGSSSTSCNVTPTSVAFSAGGVIDVRVTPNSGPSTATASCAVGVSP